MRNFRHILFPLVSVLCFCGCVSAIHEFPQSQPEKEINLRVMKIFLDSHIEPYDVLIARSRADIEAYKIRFTIEVYEEDELIQRQELLTVQKTDKTYYTDVPFGLLNRKYNLVIWAELTDQTGKSLHYHSDTLAYIHPRIPYAGNTEEKDAFSVALPLDLRACNEDQNIEVTLTRPFAKFRIISTDLAQYMAENSLTEEQVEAMSIRLNYGSFFPFGYNVLTGKPNDAITGVNYSGTVNICGDPAGLLLAFDYIWVNGSESAVTASVDIYDHNGRYITTTGAINIPYVRGKLTTITGNFLTSKSGANGISIDTRFEGEFNIVLPD